MLSRSIIDQARRVAWRCRPQMSGARAQAWARADRETFGISREGATESARRALPSAASHEAGRSEAAGRRRYWWEGREEE